MTSVKVFKSDLYGKVKAPSSKSYTHRAIVLSSLASGRSRVNRPLLARDTIATIKACQALGSSIDRKEDHLYVEGNPNLKTPDDIINVENSGTTMRLITAIASLIPKGYSIITGDESIRSRPMQPLLSALSSLGVECYSSRQNGLPPIIVKGGGIKGGEVQIRGDISSQFISALLVATPKAKNETLIRVYGKTVSRPYIDATLNMMRIFGVNATHKNYREYIIPPKQDYHSADFDVPGDFSSASLLMAFALLTGKKVTIENLNFSLPQADMRILDILEKIEADFSVDKAKGKITLSGGKILKGGEFDLSDSPDLLPVLSVIALKAKPKIIIKGVEHARFKETDRISIIAKELRKFGANVQELKDGIIVEYCEELQGCSLNSCGDHRLFMAFCAAAMASSEPCIVEGLESVDVSYPDFIKDIKSLGAIIEGA
ncbi:MAG: 3-phosphoshikimate 1-carboxyvinyltransferase [archaeon]|nr:3-phosphoshikimate 1-carboxyvinyltransferase [archaeon]MCP8313955.1 3-phosphoshikimate 1-carboxyvinyltransferase [archaeon]MCP8315829.1 3-phosphoshikimate 1-carboxyvinyltransferase [archaeon]